MKETAVTIRNELSEIGRAFEAFKSKDFVALVERVTALEKRLNLLSQTIQGLKGSGNEGSTGRDFSGPIKVLEERVTA